MPKIIRNGIEYSGGVEVWHGTQAQYNAIPVKDENTIYFIVDGVFPVWTTVTGTLEAGETSITLFNEAITTSSIIDVYTDGDVNYNSNSVSTGSVTLTYDEQPTDLSIVVRIS